MASRFRYKNLSYTVIQSAVTDSKSRINAVWYGMGVEWSGVGFSVVGLPEDVHVVVLVFSMFTRRCGVVTA